MKLQKDLLYLSISCFIVIAAWVGFHIYHVHVTSTISTDLQQQSAPIDPHFDTDLLSKLKTRQQVAPQYSALKEQTEQATQTTISPTTTPEPSIPLVTQSTPASSSGTIFLPGQ